MEQMDAIIILIIIKAHNVLTRMRAHRWMWMMEMTGQQDVIQNHMRAVVAAAGINIIVMVVTVAMVVDPAEGITRGIILLILITGEAEAYRHLIPHHRRLRLRCIPHVVY